MFFLTYPNVMGNEIPMLIYNGDRYIIAIISGY